MHRTRCRCTSASLNPSCLVDHDAERADIDNRRAAKLADLEWVARTVAESPLLSFVRPWSRITESGAHISYPGDLRGAASLTTLLSGDDAALLALARQLRAEILAAAESEAESEHRDIEDDRWAA